MIKILQLTDTHLLADRQGEMFGVNTYSAQQDLLVHIKNRITSVDYIFLAGDVSQDMSVESYQHILHLLEPLQKPTYWLAGNHLVEALIN
jgi:Icc protein